MSEPTAALLALRASTADLVQGLLTSQWSDADVAAPSLCEGWTRGHVLTHLARNADGITATLRGALHGEVVARYPDGLDARDAAISAGAGRPASVLISDVRDSAERLDRVLGAVQDADGWALPTERDHPAAHWLLARWKEVEIHRVDLAGDYDPCRWPPLLVAQLLPPAAEGLPKRTSGPLRVTVATSGSVVPDLVGRTWTVDGPGKPAEVTGPDWALLAWLVGRPAAVAGALPDPPELSAWS